MKPANQRVLAINGGSSSISTDEERMIAKTVCRSRRRLKKEN